MQVAFDVQGWLATVLPNAQTAQGNCQFCDPQLIGLHAVLDAAMGASYLAIAAVLYAVARHIQRKMPKRLALGFAGLMAGCGVVHLIESVTVWDPGHVLTAAVKILAGFLALATLVSLPFVVLALWRTAETSAPARRRLLLPSEVHGAPRRMFQHGPGPALDPLRLYARVGQAFVSRLSLITGPLQQLVDREHFAARDRRDLRAALRNARLLQRQVEAFTNAAAKTSLRPPPAVDVDVAGLVRATCSYFDPLAAERNVGLDVQADHAVMAVVDAHQLEPVLISVLFNAFKFTPRGGRVRCALSQSKDGGMFVIHVEDGSTGVSAVVREGIFVRGRGDGQASAFKDVLGLNLGVARDMVAHQGGSLTLDQGPSGGVLFTVALPRWSHVMGSPAALVRHALSAPAMVMIGTAELRLEQDVSRVQEDPLEDQPVVLESVQALVAGALHSTREDRQALAAEVARQQQEIRTSSETARVARDIAQHANKVKGNFLRIMSHELKTPITAMRLHIRLLQRSGSNTKGAKQALAGIERSSQRLLDQVDSVLEYARIESGRFVSRSQPFSLGPLMEDVIRELQAHAEQKDITLQAEVRGEVPELVSDLTLVRLIAVNLVGNAVKFTHSGAVTITTTHQNNTHQFSVTDSGPGMGKEQLAEIFDPFSQVDDIRRSQGLGSGLGLGIVKEMVEALGGTITATSQPGKGSTFTVSLPHHGSPAVPKDPDGPGSKQTLHNTTAPEVAAHKAQDAQHDDRRESIRVPIQMRFRGQDQERYEALNGNLALGGVQVALLRPPPHVEVEVLFALGQRDGQELHAMGEVVHSVFSGTHWMTSVRFVALPFPAEMAIATFLDDVGNQRSLWEAHF